MDISGSHTFPTASPQAVWNALHDAAILKACIPAADSIAWQGDTAIAVSGGVGPIHASIVAQVVEQSAPSHLKLSVSRASASGTLTVDITGSGAGSTLNYSGSVNAAGPFAGALMMARPLIDSQISQFFARLDGQIH